jgi:hydrogenase maturation protease
VKESLVLGFGNFDREDDGVAWHILAGIHSRLGRGPTPEPDEGFEPHDGSPDLLFVLQLTPEMAETIAEYQRVCFVDAHTGNVPFQVNAAPVDAEFQASPFTHHMTPATCLALSQTLHGRAPDAILVSVRGYDFGFARSLSPGTARLAEQAIEIILEWLNP